jgi:hypothetical protein
LRSTAPGSARAGRCIEVSSLVERAQSMAELFTRIEQGAARFTG